MVRAEEQRRACARVGVEHLTFLDHPDGRLENTLLLRRDIAREIRRHRPDGVITLNFDRTWGTGTWNTADHRRLGEAVMDAVADAANEWILPELAEEGYDGQPGHGQILRLKDADALATFQDLGEESFVFVPHLLQYGSVRLREGPHLIFRDPGRELVGGAQADM